MAIAYDSEEALSLAAKIASFMTGEARAASVELGERRGSFPAFHESVWPVRGFTALRNAATTCIALTGTISLIAGTSSSIEPFFALALARRLLDGRRFVEINPLVKEALEKLGSAGAASLQAIETHGSVRRLAELPEEVRGRFPTALEIAPEFHLRMQAVFQAHADAAVSKTVNLPHDAPVSAVRKIYTLAHELYLKGVTIYRSGQGQKFFWLFLCGLL